MVRVLVMEKVLSEMRTLPEKLLVFKEIENGRYEEG